LISAEKSPSINPSTVCLFVPNAILWLDRIKRTVRAGVELN